MLQGIRYRWNMGKRTKRRRGEMNELDLQRDIDCDGGEVEEVGNEGRDADELWWKKSPYRERQINGKEAKERKAIRVERKDYYTI